MIAGAPAVPVTRKIQISADTAGIAALSLAVALYLAFSPALFNDGDTSWHLATGLLILETGVVPETDPFSFTARGAPWVAHEWLAEVFMAAAYVPASWAGLASLVALSVGGLLLVVAAELRRWAAPRHVILALVALLIVLTPFILARPHVLAWPLLALWTVMLVRARDTGRAPPAAAALLMLVWANLHASFLFGLGLAGLLGLEALLQERNKREVLIGWGAFGLLSAAAALATPHGLHGFLFPLQVSGMESLPLIQEWRSTTIRNDLVFLTLTTAAGILLARRIANLSWLRIVLLGGLVVLALLHVRHQPLLWIVGLLVTRQAFGGRETTSQHDIPVGPMLACLALVVAAVRLPLPMERQDSPTTPLTAIAKVPAELRTRPVLNDYGFGGPLILAGIRPAIDGRADMYGDARVQEQQRIVDGDMAAFRNAERRWGLQWTILEPGAPLAAKLDREAGWRRLYTDQFAVVHARIR